MGVMLFLVKICLTQRGVDGEACKSPIMKWADVLKETSKKIHRS